MEYYFDTAATTQPYKQVIEEISSVLENNWGNPSSLHKKGLDAELILKKSRQIISQSLSVAENSIYFSPSGTIASNTAIMGAVQANKRRGNRIISTSVEHSATSKCLDYLESIGFEVIRISPDLDGNTIIDQIRNSINDKTILITVMHVNNEIGQVFPIEDIATVAKSINKSIIVHTDAIQSFMKLPIKLKNSNIDLLSISGHKIHGTKGIGALYIKPGTRILPHIHGGGQEGNLFSGTQNVACIAGMAKAVEITHKDIPKNLSFINELREYFKNSLTKIENSFTISAKKYSPFIICAGIKNIKSEILLHYLEARNIYVSSGSACSKGKKSRIISEYKISDDISDSIIRVSFSTQTTKDQIDFLINTLEQASKEIRKKK